MQIILNPRRKKKYVSLTRETGTRHGLGLQVVIFLIIFNNCDKFNTSLTLLLDNISAQARPEPSKVFYSFLFSQSCEGVCGTAEAVRHAAAYDFSSGISVSQLL